jgi:hypothetical protein
MLRLFFGGLAKCLGSGSWNGSNLRRSLIRPLFNIISPNIPVLGNLNLFNRTRLSIFSLDKENPPLLVDLHFSDALRRWAGNGDVSLRSGRDRIKCRSVWRWDKILGKARVKCRYFFAFVSGDRLHRGLRDADKRPHTTWDAPDDVDPPRNTGNIPADCVKPWSSAEGKSLLGRALAIVRMMEKREQRSRCVHRRLHSAGDNGSSQRNYGPAACP